MVHAGIKAPGQPHVHQMPLHSSRVCSFYTDFLTHGSGVSKSYASLAAAAIPLSSLILSPLGGWAFPNIRTRTPAGMLPRRRMPGRPSHSRSTRISPLFILYSVMYLWVRASLFHARFLLLYLIS